MIDSPHVPLYTGRVMEELALPEALLGSEVFLVGRVRTRLIRRLAEEHGRLGLRIGHGPLLICLEELGPLSQRELSCLLSVDPSDLVRYLDALEELGYVVRQQDANDRRRNLLAITPAGRAMRARYDAMIAVVEAALFGGLAAEDRMTFRRILRQLAREPLRREEPPLAVGEERP
ncbi:MAG: MarR family transcriptional regulator [Chloroflexi bacterium]|nr:MarR family transcriptional regulator [Chloroflexota bacterium]